MSADTSIEEKVREIFKLPGSPWYEAYLARMEDAFEYDFFTDGLIALGPPAVPYILERYTENPKMLGLEYVLGQIGDPRAVRPLLDELRKSPRPELQTGIISALGEIGDPQAIGDLIEIVRTTGDTWTLNAVAKIDDPKTKAALTEIVNDPNTPERTRKEIT